ncbi:MAG: N-acetylneuraminate epimerase, partial [Cardiobacterium sp.]
GSAGEAFFALDLKAPQAAWQALPPFPGGARSQPVVAALDGKLYVFGGLQKDAAGVLQLINDAHVYDPAQKTWQKLPTRAPLGLVGAAAFTHGERIYIIGGSNSPIFNGYFQDYSAAGDDEARKQAVMRAYFDQPAPDYFFNTTVFSYEPHSNQWHNEGPWPFSGRAGAAVSVRGDAVMVANGEIKPGLRTDAVAQGKFDDKGRLQWQTLPPLIAAPSGARQEGLAGAYSGFSGEYYLLAGGANFPGAAQRYDEGHFYAHEGLSKVTHATVYALHDGAWQAADALPQPAAYGVTLPYQDKLLLLGGKDNQGANKRVDVLSYDGKTLHID